MFNFKIKKRIIWNLGKNIRHNNHPEIITANMSVCFPMCVYLHVCVLCVYKTSATLCGQFQVMFFFPCEYCPLLLQTI